MSDKKKLSEHFDNLSEDAKVYIESELAYYKLDIYKKSIKGTSFLLRFFVNSALILLSFTFFFVGISLLVGYLIGYYFLGFIIVSVLLFIFALIMKKYSKPLFEKRILKIFNYIFKDAQ